MPEIAQYDTYYLPLNVFTAPKGPNLYMFKDFAYNVYYVATYTAKRLLCPKKFGKCNIRVT